MKIYTGTGDKGFTQLPNKVRVSKDDLRIEVLGTIDELNAYLGLIKNIKALEEHKIFLTEIQKELFFISSALFSFEISNIEKVKKQTHKIEKKIDKIAKNLAKLKKFIVPGNNTQEAYCHITRTICRRAERYITRLCIRFDINTIYIQYFNRLSDYLFMLSRKIT